jgi:hypothetical protein
MLTAHERIHQPALAWFTILIVDLGKLDFGNRVRFLS